MTNEKKIDLCFQSGLITRIYIELESLNKKYRNFSSGLLTSLRLGLSK